MHSVRSDFPFKDQRDYVHGSSLGETCWELAQSVIPAGEWDRPRLDATFSRLARTNGTLWVAGTQDDLPPRDRLSSWFRIFDPLRVIWIGFEEDPSSPIERRIPTSRRIEDCRLTGPFAGTCRIDVSSTTVLLENMLEANKRLHLQTVSERGVPAVLNAYMRRAPLLPGDGFAEISIENMSQREMDGAIATLSRLHCPAVSPDPFEIAFMLKFEGAA